VGPLNQHFLHGILRFLWFSKKNPTFLPINLLKMWFGEGAKILEGNKYITVASLVVFKPMNAGKPPIGVYFHLQ
jgi:hypothetical protein